MKRYSRSISIRIAELKQLKREHPEAREAIEIQLDYWRHQ